MEKNNLFLCIDNWKEETLAFLMEICQAAEGCGIGDIYLYFKAFLPDDPDVNTRKLLELMDSLADRFPSLGIKMIYDTSIIHQIDCVESQRYAVSKGMELCWGDIARFRVAGEDFVLISGFGCFEEFHEWDWELEEQYGDIGYDPMLAAEDAEHYFLKAVQDSGVCSKVIPSENAAMFRSRYEKILCRFSELLLFPEPIGCEKPVVGPVLAWHNGWKVRQLQQNHGLFSVTEPE